MLKCKPHAGKKKIHSNTLGEGMILDWADRVQKRYQRVKYIYVQRMNWKMYQKSIQT